MENLPRIWVDWNDAYSPTTFGLDLPNTIKDFEDQGLEMREGLKIRLFGDELEADAVVVKTTINGRTFFLVAEIVEGTLVEVPRDEEECD